MQLTLKHLLFAALLCALPAQAADIKVVYNKSESKTYLSFLKEALEATKDMGAYTLQASETTMGNARAIEALVENSDALSVITRGSNIGEEKKLLPIRIPLDRGLLGFRIMIVRQQDLPKFAAVDTLDQLKQLRVGQGAGWPDTKILRAAGFTVVGGTYSGGLMRMLNEGRFDMFARATWEAETQIKDQGKDMPDLVIEPTLALVYTQPRYFMVSRKGSGPALAQRLETGLRRMMANGKFDELFEAGFGEFIQRTGLRKRKIFRIDNPLLPPETPLADKALWFDPTAGKH